MDQIWNISDRIYKNVPKKDYIELNFKIALPSFAPSFYIIFALSKKFKYLATLSQGYFGA